VTEPTTPQASVLGLFRGVAENLVAAADKAAALEADLNGRIEEHTAALAPLLRDLEALNAEIAARRQILAGLTQERDDAHANATAAAAQGSYAQSVIDLAEQGPAATLTDGQLGTGEVAQ
jgi:ABC-type transporter Mla subunit MlaD